MDPPGPRRLRFPSFKFNCQRAKSRTRTRPAASRRCFSRRRGSLPVNPVWNPRVSKRFMPRRAAKQCVPRNEVRLNNIPAWVSTPDLKNLCHVDRFEKALSVQYVAAQYAECNRSNYARPEEKSTVCRTLARSAIRRPSFPGPVLHRTMVVGRAKGLAKSGPSIVPVSFNTRATGRRLRALDALFAGWRARFGRAARVEGRASSPDGRIRSRVSSPAKTASRTGRRACHR